MERIQAHRLLFANLITANAGLAPGSELAAAFASTPRERFVGPPPWRLFTGIDYIETPSDDPACLYRDVVVSLGGEGHLNNGQPTLHAVCMLLWISGRANGSSTLAPAPVTTQHCSRSWSETQEP